MAVLFTPRFQAVDANGNPYAGAQLFFYQSGTTTLITTYQDAAVSTPSVVNGAGAVVADSSGTFAPIFLNTDPFKFVLKTSGGATLATADAVPLNDAAAQLTNFAITNSLTVTSTDATAAAGPVVDLVRQSASPAASDAIGVVRFTGRDSAGTDTVYAELRGNITDPVNGTEDGSLQLRAIVNGVLTTLLTVSGAGVVLASGTVAILDLADQVITGGARVTPDTTIGTITTGTVTPDPGDRPLQSYTNGGAHTLAPGSNNGYYLLDITNNASAGVITVSGWTKVVGAFTTTNGHKFRCSCSISTAGSLLSIQAMQ